MGSLDDEMLGKFGGEIHRWCDSWVIGWLESIMVRCMDGDMRG